MVLAHNIEEGDRTQDVKISDDVTFDSMLLTNNTLRGLYQSGFYRPSPIQLHGIPLGKCGFDLLLEAKSGTGKTAVFTVITLEKLDLNKGLQAVILAPTREIAAQICDVIKQIGSGYEKLFVEVVMGGLPIEDDIANLKKNPHILVGSPGRLRHLIHDKHVDISAIRLLVLDEADKLMDKSFLIDINYIFSILPKQKQVILSSATYPESLKSVINKYVRNPQHICPDSTSILLGIKQLFTIIESNTNIVTQTQYRFKELINVLSKKPFKQCLIFCNYQVRVRELCNMLKKEQWPAEQLHGQQEQTVRLEALKTLKEYKCRILVSTDLAARGIDASNVDLVINFEPPFEWQTYLHRIGRAGRFGSYGIAITLLSKGQEEMKFKKMLEEINASIDIRNLWDDNQHLNDNTNTSAVNQTLQREVQHHNNIENNVSKHVELWDVLTQENIDNTEVFNFEELNKSFVNSEDCANQHLNDNTNTSAVNKTLQTKVQHHNNIKNNVSKHVELWDVLTRENIDNTEVFNFEELNKSFVNSEDCANQYLNDKTNTSAVNQTLQTEVQRHNNIENNVTKHVELWDVLTQENIDNTEVFNFKELNKSFVNSEDCANQHLNDNTNTSAVNQTLQTEVQHHNKENNVSKLVELWDVLTQENIDNTEVFNFEDLNKSFVNSEDCADLINSFNFHEDTVEEKNPYQHVKFHKLCYSQCCTTNNLKEDIRLNKKENIIMNLSYKDESENQIISNKSVITPFKNQENTKETNPNNIISRGGTSFGNKGDKVEMLGLDANIEDQNKALLNVGLPTSFGSSKRNRRKTSNYSKKKHNVEKSNASENQPKNSIKNDHVPQAKTTKISREEKHIKNVCNGSDNELYYDDDGYNTQSHPWESNCNSKDYNNHPSMVRTKMENYVMWYKQLKNHVKHVEIATYIEELSKI